MISGGTLRDKNGRTQECVRETEEARRKEGRHGRVVQMERPDMLACVRPHTGWRSRIRQASVRSACSDEISSTYLKGSRVRLLGACAKCTALCKLCISPSREETNLLFL